MMLPHEIINELEAQRVFLHAFKMRLEGLKNHEGSMLLGAEIGYLERMFCDYCADVQDLTGEIKIYLEPDGEEQNNG